MRFVLAWYRKNGRTLPWRYEKRPYHVLVSEVMLQQTQVSRVVVKYPEFLRRFPTFTALASADRSEIIRAWQGMGYNNRAVRLHTLARIVVERHAGRLPPSYDTLISLPGIGKYTAYAIMSSVFKQSVPVVDVNVQRVLSRVFWKMRGTSVMKDGETIWRLAFDLLPRRRVYDWNQALMDLGATVCTARSPKCVECPAGPLCASRPSMKRDISRANGGSTTRAGIPDRIYRGRVVEHLRHVSDNRGVPLDRLGSVIRPDFSARHHPWLLRLIEGLKKDGLIREHGDGTRGSRWVALA